MDGSAKLTATSVPCGCGRISSSQPRMLGHPQRPALAAREVDEAQLTGAEQRRRRSARGRRCARRRRGPSRTGSARVSGPSWGRAGTRGSASTCAARRGVVPGEACRARAPTGATRGRAAAGSARRDPRSIQSADESCAGDDAPGAARDGCIEPSRRMRNGGLRAIHGSRASAPLPLRETEIVASAESTTPATSRTALASTSKMYGGAPATIRWR